MRGPWDMPYDGQDALDQSGRHQYRLALLDFNMPGMDGLELCRRLKIFQPSVFANVSYICRLRNVPFNQANRIRGLSEDTNGCGSHVRPETTRAEESAGDTHYRIFDFSLMVSPSTTNVPFPWWWMVLGFFCVGSVQALSTSRIKRLYLFTSRVSATLHSRLAKHSAIKGGVTRWAEICVKPNASNLSISRPDELPTCTT